MLSNSKSSFYDQIPVRTIHKALMEIVAFNRHLASEGVDTRQNLLKSLE